MTRRMKPIPQVCSQCGAPLSHADANGLCSGCLLTEECGTIDASAASISSAASRENVPAPLAGGDSFGPYTPVRVLGEGGMGTVYLARQEHPIRREVALKIIRSGLGSEQILDRFGGERQALSLMEHPNVARVLDAGTSAKGRPFFVMEYVDGVPITQYCDRKVLSTRERLELFRPVCDALQHAHKKGIIHRDVKPSNILVMEVDGRPVPKVIDFGIARATEDQALDGHVFTLTGQIVGTPEYMSPEQATVDSRDIDTGTDVYSLGVVLYELLVGALPLDLRSLRQRAFWEILRSIRETPAPKPTIRLNQMGDAADEVAWSRSTDRSSLKRQLSGDLDWIVMKAIDKDRQRRYSSASEFTADIGRFLKDEPVLASPPSSGYRIRKFITRHKAPVAAAAAVLLASIAGIVATTWQAHIAGQQRLEALSEKAEAQRETQRAVESSRIALAHQLAAQASALSQESASNDALSTLLAIESARLQRLFESNVLLNKLLELIPTQTYELLPHTVQNTSTAVIFSPDGRFLAAAEQGAVVLFDVATWKKLWRFQTEDVPILQQIKFSTDSRRIAIAAGNASRVIDISTGKRVSGFVDPKLEPIDFNPDLSRILAGAVATRRLALLETATGREIMSLGGGQNLYAAFSPDGQRIAAAGFSSTRDHLPSWLSLSMR